MWACLLPTLLIKDLFEYLSICSILHDFFGGSSESQHSRPKFPYLSKRVLSDYRMFHTKKTRLWPIEGPLPPLRALWRWFDVVHPMEKENTAAIDWSIEVKKCTPQWLCLLEILPKHWEHFKDHLGIILSNLCFDMLKFGGYELQAPNLVDQLCHCLLLFPEDHRVMFQVPSKGKSLDMSGWKNTMLIMCCFSKLCLIKSSPTSSLPVSSRRRVSVNLKGTTENPKIPALVWCVTDDLSPLFSRQKLRKHPSPNFNPRCANKFWSISWSPRLTLASKWAAVGWKLLSFSFWEKGISC